MNLKSLLLIIGILTGLIFSCVPPKAYPVEPEVSFKEIKMYDGHDTLQNPVKRIILTMSVVDGDGNIGLPEDYVLPGFDTLDNKNWFINLYNKKDTVFEKVDLLAPLNYRTTFLVPKGQDKSLTADFEVTLDFTKFEDYDTVKFDFYIYDRDLNRSNTAETPALPADTTGIFTNGE